MAGAIEPCHQFCMPTENGIRFDDRSNGLQRLAAKLLTDSGKLPPFFIFESKLTVYFRSQDTVFDDEILIAKPKFFVNGAGDKGLSSFVQSMKYLQDW